MADVFAEAQVLMVAELSRLFAGRLQVGHTDAAEMLEIGTDTLTAEGDAGRIKYRQRGKRRFYSLPFLAEYLATPMEALPCPSTSRSTRTGARKARSGTTTSSSTVADFTALRAKRREQRQSV